MDIDTNWCVVCGQQLFEEGSLYCSGQCRAIDEGKSRYDAINKASMNSADTDSYYFDVAGNQDRMTSKCMNNPSRLFYTYQREALDLKFRNRPGYSAGSYHPGDLTLANGLIRSSLKMGQKSSSKHSSMSSNNSSSMTTTGHTHLHSSYSTPALGGCGCPSKFTPLTRTKSFYLGSTVYSGSSSSGSDEEDECSTMITMTTSSSSASSSTLMMNPAGGPQGYGMNYAYPWSDDGDDETSLYEY